MRSFWLAVAIGVLGASAPARADIVVPKVKIRVAPQKPAKVRRSPVRTYARLRVTGGADSQGVTLKIPRHVLRALAKKDARRKKRQGSALFGAPWARPTGVALGLGLSMLGLLLTLQMLLRRRLQASRSCRPWLGACARSWLAPALLSTVTMVLVLAWTTRARADASTFESIGMTYQAEVVVEPPLAAATPSKRPTVTIIAPRRALARTCKQHEGN